MTIVDRPSIDGNSDDVYVLERYAHIEGAIANILTEVRGAEALKVHRKYLSASKRGGSHVDQLPARLAYRDWCKTEREVRGDFAASLGWDTDRQFSPRQLTEGRWLTNRDDERFMYDTKKKSHLAWDHVEYFRSGRYPAAIITHVYADSFVPCESFAEAHGLRFQPFPWSWYYPGPDGTIAGAYLPVGGEHDQF